MQIKVTPFQKQILDEIANSSTLYRTSGEMADTFRVRPQAVGAAAKHLSNRGLLLSDDGRWTLVPDYYQKEPLLVIEDPPLRSNKKKKPTVEITEIRNPVGEGDLLEIVGWTEAGTMVLRHIDTRTLIPVRTHTPVEVKRG